MVKRAGKATTTSSSSTPPLPPSTLTDGLPLPKMIVFDLDYTLWPFWVDTHVTAPLKASPDHSSVKDRFGEPFSFYGDVPTILSSLRAHGIKIGAASRTSAPDLGREMLRLLQVSEGEGGKRRKAVEFFDYMEIYPGSKITHFVKLEKASGLRYEEMLFFDDEARNRNVESLGVHMQLVRDGVTREEIDNGVRAWRAKHGHEGAKASSSSK